jgi:hypothetical protein
MLVLTAGAILSAAIGQAALITQTLGDQDFTNGQVVGSATFTGANGGDPVPFNTFIGSDVNGPNFSTSWTFNSYGGAILDPILSATLTFGIYDNDSAAPGSQVGSAAVGATDLTSLIDAAFEANPGANSEVRVYTITLPGSAFTQLATGSATFSLALAGPGLGALGATTFNGAGLDFSRLDITTQAGSTVPEPGTISLLGAGLALFLGTVLFRRRRAEA